MRLLLTAAAAGAFFALAGTASLQAAPAAAQTPAPWANSQPSTLLEPVHYYYPRCRWWRRECSARWGFATWRYNRCMYLHGC